MGMKKMKKMVMMTFGWFDLLKVATVVTTGSTYGGEANPATDALFNLKFGKVEDEEDAEEN